MLCFKQESAAKKRTSLTGRRWDVSAPVPVSEQCQVRTGAAHGSAPGLPLPALLPCLSCLAPPRKINDTHPGTPWHLVLGVNDFPRSNKSNDQTKSLNRGQVRVIYRQRSSPLPLIPLLFWRSRRWRLLGRVIRRWHLDRQPVEEGEKAPSPADLEPGKMFLYKNTDIYIKKKKGRAGFKEISNHTSASLSFQGTTGGGKGQEDRQTDT